MVVTSIAPNHVHQNYWQPQLYGPMCHQMSSGAMHTSTLQGSHKNQPFQQLQPMWQASNSSTHNPKQSKPYKNPNPFKKYCHLRQTPPQKQSEAPETTITKPYPPSERSCQ